MWKGFAALAGLLMLAAPITATKGAAAEVTGQFALINADNAPVTQASYDGKVRVMTTSKSSLKRDMARL